MTTTSHTPTPWSVDKVASMGGAPIIRATKCWMGNSRDVAKVLYHCGGEDPEVSANAAFIVRACNSHNELVQVLKGILPIFQRLIERHEPDNVDNEWIAHAREALAHAEGRD